jgi:type IX secretion system PorP/SprF family membrane protein
LLKVNYIASVMRFLCGYILIAFIYSSAVNGQDFHFTQFYANKLYLAPSFAGATEQNRLIANYRNQWMAVNGYTTYSFSFDHYFSNFNSGLGVLVMRDVAGDGNLGYLHIGVPYSYDFSLTESIHLRPGLSLNFLQLSIDYARLIFSSDLGGSNTAMTNEEYAGIGPVNVIDASTSLILYAKNWMGGVTFDHLMTPNISFLGNNDRIPLRYSMYGSLTILRRGRLLKPVDETVSLAFMLKDMQKYVQADVGIYWAQIPLTFGLWYRGIPILNSDRGDAFAVLAGIKKMHFTIGYSYDFTISNLVNKTAGTHEISLVYEFAKAKRKKIHAVPCPEF